jgi:hypothetical protein
MPRALIYEDKQGQIFGSLVTERVTDRWSAGGKLAVFPRSGSCREQEFYCGSTEIRGARED